MSADRMILGQGTNAVFSMDSQETGLNNNVIVAASCGGGKTLSIMEPRLIETHHSSLIVTVSKRRIVEKYTDMFLTRGYEVLDLNFVQPEKSTIAYDPMEYIKDSGDITFLASALVKSNPRKACTTADPFWDDISISLLSALIALVQKDIFKPTFADVLELNDLLTIKEDGDCISTSLDSRFDELARRDPHSFAVTSWNSFKNLPIKTANCVYGTLNTTLDKIFTPQLRRMIADKKKIAFERLASRKTVLFVSTSAVNPSLSAYPHDEALCYVDVRPVGNPILESLTPAVRTYTNERPARIQAENRRFEKYKDNKIYSICYVPFQCAGKPIGIPDELSGVDYIRLMRDIPGEVG